MKKYTLLGLLFLLFGVVNALSGTYSGGDGTSGNPYQISKTADLIELSNTSGDWSKHFIQTADIVFNDWDDWHGFTPIGNNNKVFTGSYNGQNRTISNLYINRASSYYIGLFEEIGRGSTVSNIGLLNVYISGGIYVGGLVGRNAGTVSGSYSTGSVSGSYYVIGGLVGANYGTVSGSYFAGSVSGNYVGGLVENNSGTVSGSYSTGSVSGNSAAGGLVRYNYNGTASGSYWDTETSGQSSSAGGTGKTTIQMKTLSTFTSWDFTTTWNIQDSSSYYSYPYLRAFTYDTPGADPAVNPIPGLFKKKYSGGFGTVGYPYQISTTDDLIKLSNTKLRSIMQY